ncbi:MAG TPA: GerMN domain-containing protein [Vicinamibacterales bacterium]|nr:GerMN domain-containing protein [Vicinamibacterales bacterium]
MNSRRAAIAALAVFAIAAAWVLFVGLPRWYSARRAQSAAPAATAGAPAAPVRKITATLFYVSEDGMALQPVQREVPFGQSVAEQAHAIIQAQLAAAAPQVSAIPPGVALRNVFVTERGDAFVNLSADISAKHPGGSLLEVFTVYTLVNALTVNLPAISRVQILVEGKEVDTLAGHVDLRHPLAKSLEWVVHDTQ